jgi:hypothetical protein
MSFFDWKTDESTGMISPYIAVYFGLTALCTGATFWRWKTWTDQGDLDIEEVLEDLEKGSILS